MGLVNLVNGGLDVQGIVDNLIYVEREPIRKLEQQSKAYQTKISAYQTFNAKLLSFKTSIEGLLYHGSSMPLSYPSTFEERLRNSSFALRTAESSDAAVLTATAEKGTVIGNFSITVTSLARSDAYASSNFDSTTAITTQTGTLVIQKGSGEAITITIDETNNTLAGIRSAVNNSGAGVTAGIVNDGSAAPYRLVITSDDSGTANALTITNNLNQGAGQALTLSQTVAAADAALQINGVNITSSSNAVTGAIEGVTLNLRAASGTAVVSVGRDLEGILEKLRDFAAKYSEVAGYISSQFRYDPNKKDAGVLAGDFTLRDTQSRLSSTLSLNINSDNAALRLLTQIGFKLANDGTLSIDETALRSSLESDFRGTAHVILADAVNLAGETVSIGPRMYSQLKELTDSLDGSVFRARDNVQKDIDRLNKQIRDMEERLEIKRDLLIMQFGRADLALRQMSVLQNSLMGQINSLQLLNG